MQEFLMEHGGLDDQMINSIKLNRGLIDGKSQ